MPSQPRWATSTATSLPAGTTLLSEGSVNATVSSGKDLFVLAYGNVTGTYQTFRDASVITYGTFDARLSAGRDISFEDFGRSLPGVSAVGNIRDTITAGRNVGHYDEAYPLIDDFDYDIFSYGSIDAAIFARNNAGSTEGGQIGSVGARGSIDGLIVAGSSIGAVVSGTVSLPHRREAF
jgi:hypothetical protein